MAWTTPRTYVATELVTAVILNGDVRDNLRELWHEVLVQDFTAAIAPTGEWTSSAVTFSGNPIRLQFDIPFAVGPNTGGSQVATKWRKDGADFADAMTAFNNVIASADSMGVAFRKRVAAPSSGSHTYGLKNNGGTGMTFHASAGSPATLTIWEKGGS
jgi:hypothetical protein